MLREVRLDVLYVQHLMDQTIKLVLTFPQNFEQMSMILSFYRRHVDDTLVSMPNTESVTDFLQVLNKVHPSLSFTMEFEHDGSIPFLDTVLTRCDNTLTTD